MDRLLQNSTHHLKHSSYVDHVSCVLPMFKDGFNGKYIELIFLIQVKNLLTVHIKIPNFYYASIDPGLLALKRHDYNKHNQSTEMKDWMKQHLFVFKPNSTEIMYRD